MDIAFDDCPSPVFAEGRAALGIHLYCDPRVEAGGFEAIVESSGAGVEADDGWAASHVSVVGQARSLLQIFCGPIRRAFVAQQVSTARSHAFSAQ